MSLWLWGCVYLYVKYMYTVCVYIYIFIMFSWVVKSPDRVYGLPEWEIIVNFSMPTASPRSNSKAVTLPIPFFDVGKCKSQPGLKHRLKRFAFSPLDPTGDWHPLAMVLQWIMLTCQSIKNISKTLKKQDFKWIFFLEFVFDICLLACLFKLPAL